MILSLHSCWITTLPPVKAINPCSIPLIWWFPSSVNFSFDGNGSLSCVVRFWIGRRHLQSTKRFKLALEESNEHVRRGLRKLSPSREGSNWNAFFYWFFFAGQWIKLLANLFGSFQRASASIFHVHYSLCVFTARYLGKRGSSFVQGLARKRMTGIQYIDVYSLCPEFDLMFRKGARSVPPNGQGVGQKQDRRNHIHMCVFVPKCPFQGWCSLQQFLQTFCKQAFNMSAGNIESCMRTICWASHLWFDRGLICI